MTDTTKIILACDESGAKGYADKDESFPGEVGVFAGILIPDECEKSATAKFQKIYDRYKPSNGKLHITDIPDDQKESLREEVYRAIQALGLPCFWYAIHVAGLHAWYKSNQSILQGIKENLQAAKGGGEPRVKGGSPRPDPASMHVELFSGLYGHLIAFLEERGRKELEIEVRSDLIDSPIVKKFEDVAERLLSEDPSLTNQTGFDTITKKVLSGGIRIETKFPPEMDIEVVVRSLCINPVADGDGHVLAADVLANSLNYLFKSRKCDELYSALNAPEAVAVHPLAEHLDAFMDWGTGDLLGDELYRHPKATQS